MCTYNTIRLHTDHFEIRKNGFRIKFIGFCKSVSQERENYRELAKYL